MKRLGWRTLFPLILLAELCLTYSVYGVASAQAIQGNRTFPTGTNPTVQRQLPPLLGNQPWITLLCKFADIDAEPKQPSYFQALMGDQPGRLNHYWQESSYGSINVENSRVVDQWVSLPHPQSYYVEEFSSGEIDSEQLKDDCVAAAGDGIDFESYYGVNVALNWGWVPDDPDGSYAVGWYDDYGDKVVGFTVLPPFGYDDPATLAHEMGHGFGLPHSSGQYGETYDNPWDVMSGDELVHTIAYHKDLLGWIPFNKKVVVAWGSHTTITLEQLALPQSDNALVVFVPIASNSAEFYTIEVRRQVGYDQDLPGNGVILHEVNNNREEPAHLIDADGNGDNFDEGVIWRAGETFSDAPHEITISILQETATGFVVEVVAGAASPPREFPISLYMPNIVGRE